MSARCEHCGSEVGLADMPSPFEIVPRNERNERIVLCLTCQQKRKKSFSFIGIEVVETVPKASGNGAVAYVPKKWIGHNVAIVRLD